MARNFATDVIAACIAIAALIGGPASSSTQTPEAPNRVERLLSKARELESSGRYFEALRVVEELLWLVEGTFGRDDPVTMTTVIHLGRLYQNAAAYEQAEASFKRALAVLEPVSGEEARVATVLNDLASLYHQTGRYEEAERLYDRALALAARTLGPHHDSTDVTRVNLAALYAAQARYDKARELLEQALKRRENLEGPGDPGTARMLNNLGDLYRLEGDYRNAESTLRRALAMLDRIVPEHPSTAMVLNNLGLVYCATADYVQAQPILERALAIREKVLGPMHPDTRQSLTNLGGVYHDTGAYDRAEELYTRAVRVAETIGPDSPGMAASLVSLAGLYRSAGAYEKALPLYDRALSIRRKTLGSEHPDTVGILKSQATLYHSSGASVALPRRLYTQALAIERKVLGREHPTTSSTLANLAALLHDSGNHAAAEPLYREALAIDVKTLGDRHPRIADLLNRLALLAWAAGRWSDAYASMARSVEIEEWNARRLTVVGDESRKRAYMETLRTSGVLALNLSLALRGRISDAETFGLEVVLQRKGRVQDVMAQQFAWARERMSPPDRELLEEWQRNVTLLTSFALRGPGSVPPDLYGKLLQTFERKARALETTLTQRSAAVRSELEAVTVARVQQAIPRSSALVEWFQYRPFNPNAIAMKDEALFGAARYVAFVLKREGAPAMVEIGDAETIDRAVRDLLFALHEPGATAADRLAHDLDRLLMQPLRRHLGDTEDLLLSPDGMLNLAPFSLLRDERGRYLLQQKRLTYLTSGRDLLRAPSVVTSARPPMVLAAPDYDLADPRPATARREASTPFGGAPGFTPLPGTRAEASAIKAILRLEDAHVLTGARATESALKQVEGPRILHLATHGFFLEDEIADLAVGGPLDQGGPRAPTAVSSLVRSGLALAGANRQRIGDDGILTALEVAGLDLGGTELAVLSACESGKGDVKNGEGVYGLRRALVLAGARTLVVSLWKVDDEATKELMVDFYRRLGAGAGRSQAMRAAQLAMLANPGRADPFYWGAFAVIGDPGPLPQ